MMRLLRQSWLVGAVLWCAVLASAAGAVYTTHRSRELFAQLGKLQDERDRLDVAWMQWQTEQGTFTTHATVEAVATTRLHMVAPDPAKIELVSP